VKDSNTNLVLRAEAIFGLPVEIRESKGNK